MYANLRTSCVQNSYNYYCYSVLINYHVSPRLTKDCQDSDEMLSCRGSHRYALLATPQPLPLPPPLPLKESLFWWNLIMPRPGILVAFSRSPCELADAPLSFHLPAPSLVLSPLSHLSPCNPLLCPLRQRPIPGCTVDLTALAFSLIKRINTLAVPL